MKNAKFLGLQYPLVTTHRGILAQKSGVDQIKADLLQLLLTNPGERVMLPEFGVDLRSLLFEPNDTLLEIEARRRIIQALERWEPRVQIQDVVVAVGMDEDDLNPEDTMHEKDNILSIKITFYDPQDISIVDELAIALPMGGG